MDTERAWAAGFFDGEGSSCLTTPNGRQRRNVKICITQNDPEVLERFCAAVGHGAVRGPYERGGRNPYWQYNAFGLERCDEIMGRLWPYLGSLKKAQYEKAAGVVRSAGVPHHPQSDKCRRGHRDWRMTPKGRVCRICQNAAQKRWRDRKKTVRQ